MAPAGDVDAAAVSLGFRATESSSHGCIYDLFSFFYHLLLASRKYTPPHGVHMIDRVNPWFAIN